MQRLILIIAIASVFTSCGGKKSESAADSDTTAVSSTTPPARQDTNPIGVMMGDTTIGINDSLNNANPQK